MNAKVSTLVFSSVLLLFLVGCSEQVTIGEIQQDPGFFHDKDVLVRGKVAQSFGAFRQGVYEIDDGTGRLWVFVESGGVPSQGAGVETFGRIVPGITFAGQNYATVLRERKHRLVND